MSVSPEKAAALARFAEYVNPQRVAFWRESDIPLVIGRREGDFIWDLDGHRLYDLHLNGGTFNLGHRNPELIAAMCDAAAEVDIGNHHFPSPARADLAARLAGLTPGALHYSVFASGGSEAVDIAIKSVRAATGRRRLVVLDHGYHGRTGLSGAAGDAAAAAYFNSDAPEDFIAVPFDDLEPIEHALEGGDVAAVMLESIPATYGFPIPSPGYLRGAVAAAHRAGALYIADEVQSGLGRTGRLWAIERDGAEPDVLVTGKGFSGGVYPIAAAVLSPAAAGWLHEYGWGHVSTFGGSEIGCRVAEKVLEITTRPETTVNVARLTAAFAEGLARVAHDDPWLTEIRQAGLVMGLRFDHPNGGVYMQHELYKRGIWAIAAGFDHSILQWKPSLLLDPERVGDILDRLQAAMRAARERNDPVPRRHRVTSHT